jgi:CTP-dependent riboflavin kinase
LETKIKLDYTLQKSEDRKALVEKIIKQTPPEQMTEKYIEILSNYIIFAMDKEEKKKREIITDNRLVTINKRETSYQGLVTKFENGEDGLFNITIENDKNIILTPKVSITPKDVAEIPELQALKESIEFVKNKEVCANGKEKYQLKK